MSQTELARHLKVTPQAVQAWESNRTVPRPAKYMELAKLLGITLDTLADKLPTKDDLEESVRYFEGAKAMYREMANAGPREVPGYLDTLGALDGTAPQDDEEVEAPFLVEVSVALGRSVIERSHQIRQRFSKPLLRARGIDPDSVVCMSVSGNSMEPVLPDGSIAGIDLGSTAIIDGKMFALDHDGQLRLKLVFRLPGGGIRLRSFNRVDHPDEEYSQPELEESHIQVLGRVFWSSAAW